MTAPIPVSDEAVEAAWYAYVGVFSVPLLRQAERMRAALEAAAPFIRAQGERECICPPDCVLGEDEWGSACPAHQGVPQHRASALEDAEYIEDTARFLEGAGFSVPGLYRCVARMRDRAAAEREGVGTGAGKGASGQVTGAARVTRSTDCPEAPAQAHPLPEPGTRVRVRYEGEGVVDGPEVRDGYRNIRRDDGARIISLKTLEEPGVTWEPVEPRDWVNGDVVVCADRWRAIAWIRREGMWRSEGWVDLSDDRMNRLLAHPQETRWTTVRVFVRGGVDV